MLCLSVVGALLLLIHYLDHILQLGERPLIKGPLLNVLYTYFSISIPPLSIFYNYYFVHLPKFIQLLTKIGTPSLTIKEGVP